MNIRFSDQNMSFHLEMNKVCTILGDNENPKLEVLNILKEGFEGGLGSQFMVDNIDVSKNEYEVLYFTDEQDFESVFKFTKSNLYKKCLYQQVFTDEVKVKIKDVVDLFTDSIKDINRQMDACFHNAIHFNTQLDDIENIISENTVVCLNGEAVKLSEKYYKKLLLFQLLSFYIVHSEREKIVVFIEDIDAYFSESSLMIVCQMILALTKGREVYFIITGTTSFLYTYFYNREHCYKIRGDNLYQLGDLEQIAVEVFIRNQYYMQQKCEHSLSTYLNDHLQYITADDVQYVLTNYFIPNIDRVGRLFCNDQVLIVNPLFLKSFPTMTMVPYTNLYEREFFSLICDRLGIDKVIQ